MDTRQANGSCLCGKIKVKLGAFNSQVYACHCGMCRKWSGSLLMSVDAGKSVQFEGEEYIQVYDSSAWAERGFCKNCGTHLFYRVKATQDYFLPIGLLDDIQDDQVQFVSQIYIDRKPAYFSFANPTQTMTEAQVMTMFAPEE